jgi:ferritin-like metal-binding protein YciE
MPIKNSKELFVALLSSVRHQVERSGKIYSELGQAAQNEEIKEALQAREMIAGQDLTRIDECFKLIGQTPIKMPGKLQEVFIEDFRRELGEIESSVARRIFVLAKATHLLHLQMAEYIALITVADTMGHPGVGVLLESCLSDKVTFVERSRHLIREHIKEKVAAA